MATLNDIADAFESIVGAISGVTFYSEPIERPEASAGGVSVELFFVGRQRATHGAAGRQSVNVALEVSTPSDAAGWKQAIRLGRQLVDYQGSHGKSIEAAIEADTTLGGVVESARYRSTGDEIRKEFPDGWRWTIEQRFEVKYKP